MEITANGEVIKETSNPAIKKNLADQLRAAAKELVMSRLEAIALTYTDDEVRAINSMEIRLTSAMEATTLAALVEEQPSIAIKLHHGKLSIEGLQARAHTVDGRGEYFNDLVNKAVRDAVPSVVQQMEKVIPKDKDVGAGTPPR